jgi:hypothetical protein
MLAISCEDTSWKYSFYVEIAAYAALIGAYNCIDTEQLLKTAEVAEERVDDFAHSLPKPDSLGEMHPPLPEQIHPADYLGRYSEEAAQIDPVRSFRGACHSLGAVLYRARQYELAIPLFEMAMAYQFMSKYLARCYVASVWVITRDRERILSFVNEVAPMFGNNRDWWKSIPELKDLANAPSLSG